MQAFRASVCLAAAVLAAITLFGCGGGGGDGGGGPIPPSGATIYSAYKVGAKWDYRVSTPGSPAETSSREVVGKQIYSGVNCLKILDGDVDQYVLCTMTSESGLVAYAEIDVGATEPYTPPQKWGPDSSLADYSSTSTHYGVSSTVAGHVVNSAESVTVPYGTFSAVHVRNTVTEDGHSYYEDSWWVSSIGEVKRVYTSGGTAQETSELTAFTPVP
jgi:hypothetical protein